MAMTSASRYATSAMDKRGGSLNGIDNNVSVSESGSQTGSQNTSTSQVQTGVQNSSQVQETSQRTQNMSPQTLAALERLIGQLASGGTPEMRAQNAQRSALLESTAANAAGYSKAAAFGDAQGLISQQMRRTLESLLPSINRAAEDAGSSGGALRALLLQDAADKAAESSSALGVQTAVNYGNIQTNFAQVLEAFSRQDPKATEMLIGALNVAKGAVQQTNGTTTTNGTQTSTTTTNGSQSQSSSQNTSGNKQVNTDYAPFQVTAPISTSPQYFGPSAPADDPSKYIGTTVDTLAQLSGGGSPWSKYSF
jgi:hypothetical protein